MRKGKQFLYGGIYALVWVGIAAAIYFLVFWVPPSCSDGKQNGSEAGIDCGGTCKLACLAPVIQPVRVSEELRILALPSARTAPRASLLFEVQNVNENVAAKSFPYTITFYDAGSAALGTKSGTSYIYEREVKQIVVPNVELPALTSYGKVSVGDADWVSATVLTKPKLSVLETRGSIDGSWVRAEGTVVNGDIVMLPVVTLTALFYDAGGTVVGASTREFDRINPHDSKQFSIEHPLDSRIDINRTPRVIAEALRP